MYLILGHPGALHSVTYIRMKFDVMDRTWVTEDECIFTKICNTVQGLNQEPLDSRPVALPLRCPVLPSAAH